MGEGLQRATAATYGVKIGQRWIDNDPRCKEPRVLLVYRFRVSDTTGELFAHCLVEGSKRKTSIKVSRFKQGYRLVSSLPERGEQCRNV